MNSASAPRPTGSKSINAVLGRLDRVSLLELEELNVVYSLGKYKLHAVDNVDLEIDYNEIVALVGESGCGKSTLANAICGMLKPPASMEGAITFEGENLLKLAPKEVTKFRWKGISIVPQASQNSLNPTMRVKDHFVDTMRAHGVNDKKLIEEKAVHYLREVLLDPSIVLNSYPHELSGGMSQRVLIALSLVLDPKLVILDEPTSALDLITQRQILELIKDINTKNGVSLLVITHDLTLIRGLADRTILMYCGKVMEVGPTEAILSSPSNPYTYCLLKAIPKLRGDMSEVRAIAGDLPSINETISGCKFHSRCPYAKEICVNAEPPFELVGPNHYSHCHFAKTLSLS